MTTTTVGTNPPGWRPEWPPFSGGPIYNVVHFGANPADDGGDDGPAIQNTIDFAAGEKTLAQVAPVSMPESWRLYYQFWEDIDHYAATGVWAPHYDYYALGMLEGEEPLTAAELDVKKDRRVLIIAMSVVITLMVAYTVWMFLARRKAARKGM